MIEPIVPCLTHTHSLINQLINQSINQEIEKDVRRSMPEHPKYQTEEVCEPLTMSRSI